MQAGVDAADRQAEGAQPPSACRRSGRPGGQSSSSRRRRRCGVRGTSAPAHGRPAPCPSDCLANGRSRSTSLPTRLTTPIVSGKRGRHPERRLASTPACRTAPADEQQHQQQHVQLRQVPRQQRCHPVEPPGASDHARLRWRRPGRPGLGRERVASGERYDVAGRSCQADAPGAGPDAQERPRLAAGRAQAGCRHGDSNGRRRRVRADGRRHRRGVRAGRRTRRIVREVDEAALARGLERIKQSMGTAVARGRLSEADRDAAVGRLRGVTDMERLLADCDLVDRGRDRERAGQAGGLHGAGRRLRAGDDPGQQHLVDPDHRPGERDEAAGPGARACTS